MSQALSTMRRTPSLTVRLLGPPSPSAILTAAAALICMGLVAVFSATGWRSLLSDRPDRLPALLDPQGLKHLCYATIAVAVMALTARADYRKLAEGSWLGLRPSTLLLGVALCLLSLAAIPGLGVERHGARRWLSLGPASWGLTFQPSEMAKFALVIWLAERFSSGRADAANFRRGLLPALLAIGLTCGLIGLEDFGTAALIAMVGMAMLVVAGARIGHIVGIGALGAAAFGALLVAKPYRLQRLAAFANIWADPLGSGYHAVQSLLAIAGGGWTGKGLGAGLQKFGYLPEAHNDFIFALICEEMGFIGAAAVIGLFVVLISQAASVISLSRDPFGRLLTFGLIFTIASQAAMNMAVVTVLAPTKGIALPLVSAGGTGLTVTAAAVGLLAAVAATALRTPDAPGPPGEPDPAANSN